MKVELFIHGVPSGEGFWGKKEDRNYFATFYDRSDDEVKFLIQNRLSQGQPYCYYHYLVYKTSGSPTPNVVANDGRDGSYFGLSLRLDAYCKDVMNMYRILDTIYHIYVYGDLLKMDKSKLRYTFSDFSNVAQKLKAIETETIKLIQNGFYAESFTSLDGFATNGSKAPLCNLFEVSSEEVMQVMKQSGKIVLSPFYQTRREQQILQKCESQISTIKQQFEQDKSAFGATLTPLKNQVTSLQQEVAQRDKSIEELQKEIQNKGQNKQIIQLVSTLREPVAELSRTLHSISPKAHGKGSRGTSSQPSVLKMLMSFAPVINLILLVILISLVMGLSKRASYLPAETTEIPVGKTVVTSDRIPQETAAPLSEDDEYAEEPEDNVSPFSTETDPAGE